VQCAEDHRQMVASLNGMAGIHMIRENWLAAAEAYRQVLSSAKQHEEHFSTDSLQVCALMLKLC
jgi:E3 ubiquitin-protein ligase SHPRH